MTRVVIWKRFYKNTKFYDRSSYSEETEKDTNAKSKKASNKEKPYLLKCYERDLIVEKGGKLSGSNSSEDEEAEINFQQSYHKEQSWWNQEKL